MGTHYRGPITYHSRPHEGCPYALSPQSSLINGIVSLILKGALINQWEGLFNIKGSSF